MSKKKGAKKDSGRDEKGRFKPGYSGGPGRGNRNLKPLTYEDIELLLQSDLKDSDPKVRHTATRLLIALKNKMPDQDDGKILDPIFMPLFKFLWDFADGYREQTGQSISMIEAIDVAANHLANCPSSPITTVEFEEVGGEIL
jgi:hypothetical protein